MKLYQGRREWHRTEVTVDGKLLEPSLDLWIHSLTGFEWGYGGSGPAQLALAILADYLSNDNEALRFYQDFKRIVVVRLPYRGWMLTTQEIQQAINALKPSHPSSDKMPF